MDRSRKLLGPRPPWLKVKIPSGEGYQLLKSRVNKFKLHTVCEEARCPNIAECWSSGIGTIMILGDTCTRACGFCAVKTGKPSELDLDEPRRVREAVEAMGLKYVVITSVNRDELNDGGASIWSATIKEIRIHLPSVKIEVLIPDFQGNLLSQDTVFNARPDVINHNIETIPRLYRYVRPQAKYQQSLDLIKRAKEAYRLTTKSGLMVGIGETEEEVKTVLKQLYDNKCDIITIGQYLQPTSKHIPVDRFVSLEEFSRYKSYGNEIGIKHVESGPLVRSSYHADKQAKEVEVLS